jgi:hypothetical protein
VRVDGAGVGTARADSFGIWTFTLTSPLEQGAHTATVSATDAAGNTGPVSLVRGFTVDTVAPAAPVFTAPGAFVNVPRPTLAGTAEAGSTVTVLLDGMIVGTVTADVSGGWRLIPSAPLAQGAHVALATARDAAGNASASALPLHFAVDMLAPEPPVVVTPSEGESVSPDELSFTGTAEAGSTVTVSVDGLLVGTATADPSGQWSATTVYALAEGPHTVTATAADGAGNVSLASIPRAFTVESRSCGCASSPSEGMLALCGWFVLRLWARRRGRREQASP